MFSLQELDAINVDMWHILNHVNLSDDDKKIRESIVEKITSDNKQSASASQIADSIEAACFVSEGTFVHPRKSWLREWVQQLRTL